MWPSTPTSSSSTAAPDAPPAPGTPSTRSCASCGRWADDETLLVQSGKPVGVFRTHEWAPRVLIANSNLVGEWANWDEFRRLEALGLTMYGQMTAGSWIYIGSQGIVQGTYECFAEIARRRFGGSLAGTITLDGGARRDGRRAAAGGDDERRGRPLHRGRSRAGSDGAWRPRYLDEQADDLDDAIDRCRAAKRGAPGAQRRPRAATPPRSCPSCCGAGSTPTWSPTRRAPTIRWSGTSRPGSRWRRPTSFASADPDEYIRRARASAAAHCFAMVGFKDAGAEVFDYGNSLRREAQLGGFERAFDYPGFVPAYIRPLFCEGKGPFRWAALSGDPADIAATDRAVLEEFPEDEALARWIRMAARADRLPGPAGADLLARLRRAPPARAALQRDGPQRRDQRPDRDRPRPPRLGLGRLALPRDRGDGATAPTRSPTGRC